MALDEPVRRGRSRVLVDVGAVHEDVDEAGVEREEAQGKRFAEAARRAGVEYYVYSSVGSAHRETGIPHFDNKARIEQRVREHKWAIVEFLTAERRAADHQPLARDVLLDATEQIERRGEIVRPDVAPIDHARRQPFLSWEPVLRYEIEVLRAPHEIEPNPVDRQCGSSQQAISFGAQAILSGTADVILAGGMQNMSQIPIAAAMVVGKEFGFTSPTGESENWRHRYGDEEISQFRGAELIAERWNISREEMERFALTSHERALAAIRGGISTTRSSVSATSASTRASRSCWPMNLARSTTRSTLA